MSNDINALRDILFDTLREVKAGKMDIDRAKATNETGRTIIETVKAEIDYLRVTGSCSGTEFIPATGAALGNNGSLQTAHGTATTKQIGEGATLTTHRMKR